MSGRHTAASKKKRKKKGVGAGDEGSEKSAPCEICVEKAPQCSSERAPGEFPVFFIMPLRFSHFPFSWTANEMLPLVLPRSSVVLSPMGVTWREAEKRSLMETNRSLFLFFSQRQVGNGRCDTVEGRAFTQALGRIRASRLCGFFCMGSFGLACVCRNAKRRLTPKIPSQHFCLCIHTVLTPCDGPRNSSHLYPKCQDWLFI